MRHPKPITIIDLAVKGAILRIEEIQRKILLIEKFGNKVMLDENLYHPEDLKRNSQLFNISELYDDMDELIVLAAKLTTAREKYFDKQFEDLFNQFFSNIA